jgi:undecaprenyl-diphosphatase
MNEWLAALILGLVEGLTEFIPVSSTGHLVLAKELLGLTDNKWNAFIVLIQLGAILAVVALYFQRLWSVALRIPSDPGARRFVLAVLVAFLPAVVAGLVAHKFISDVLLDAPMVICVSLIVGGVALILLEKFAPAPRTTDAMNLNLKEALGVGLFQCLALIPGVSRSGATIAGGLMLGLDKRAAAEFSFFLAIPTMAGAFALDAWENRNLITPDYAGVIALGFVVSFVSGWFVIKVMLDYVQKHGFALFAWWRIIVGLAGIGAIWAGWL